MRISPRPVISVLCLAIGLMLPSAYAADADAGKSDKPLWEMRLAAFGRYGAAYPASDENQLDIVPLPLPIYRGTFWRIGEDRDNPIRGRLFRRDRVKLDFAFDLTFPVDSDDVDVRRGMPDLDLLLEVGPELEIELATEEYFSGRSFLGLQLRPAFSFDGLSPTFEGFVFNPELTYRKKINDEKDEFKVRLTPAFATGNYMDYFYAVEPQFATPTRPAYSADDGYLGTELTFTWLHAIKDDIDIVVGTTLSFHHGATNDDSPLFTDKTTYSAYAAFTWKFWESKRRARGNDDSWL